MNKADLLTLLINFSSILDPLLTLLVILSTITGVVMVVQGLMNAYALNLNNGRSNATVSGILWSLFIGGVLVAPIYTVQIFGNTLLDVSVNSSSLLYQGVGLTDTQRQAVKAIFGLFSITGFIAFYRGWVTLNKHFNGVIKDGAGMGMTFVVGGVLLIYLDVLLDIVGEKAGFDFTKVLTF